MFDELEYEPEMAFEFETMDDIYEDDEELELAAELLSITDDEELELFLGKLVKRVASGAKKFLGSSTGKALVGGLKGLARKALPVAATALGTAIGGPAGGAIGGKLGRFASGLFEFEGDFTEEEFEAAKQIIKVAKAAAKNAAENEDKEFDPRRLAMGSINHAARRYAPQLMRRVQYASRSPRASRTSGRWYRRGSNIILQGV